MGRADGTSKTRLKTSSPSVFLQLDAWMKRTFFAAVPLGVGEGESKAAVVTSVEPEQLKETYCGRLDLLCHVFCQSQ